MNSTERGRRLRERYRLAGVCVRCRTGRPKRGRQHCAVCLAKMQATADRLKAAAAQ